MFAVTSLSLSLAWEGDLGVCRGWRCGSGISTVVASFFTAGVNWPHSGQEGQSPLEKYL